MYVRTSCITFVVRSGWRGLPVVMVWGAHSGQREKRDEAFFSSFRNKKTFFIHIHCLHSGIYMCSGFLQPSWAWQEKWQISSQQALQKRATTLRIHRPALLQVKKGRRNMQQHFSFPLTSFHGGGKKGGERGKKGWEWNGDIPMGPKRG